MTNALYALMDLQEVDRELDELEALKGDLPQDVEKLKSTLTALKTKRDTLQGELETVRKSKMHGEMEMKSHQEQLKKYQDQLYEVTSNREYDALTTEIDATKAKIDALETMILESFESEERLSAEIQEVDSQIQGLEEERKGKEHDLSLKVKETEAQHQEFMARRQEILKNISKPLLSQYERIRRAKDGVAVVAISDKYACEGCFTSIPPQRAMEIRFMDRLIVCESCGRILVYQNERENVDV